jgi:hypothetical protein
VSGKCAAIVAAGARPHASDSARVNAATEPPLISPVPSAQEAAAIVAALERFAADTAPPTRAGRAAAGGWLRAARIEAVGRAPGGPAGSGDRRPWRDRVRAHEH